METDNFEMGPVDYLVVEWPGRQPTGEAIPYLIDLVDRGLIRILDLVFLAKDGAGDVVELAIADLGDAVAELAIFEGAGSGLIADEDRADAASVLEPETSAALLIYENTWAGPFAAALRRTGAQLVAGGRVPVQALLASLEAAEEAA